MVSNSKSTNKTDKSALFVRIPTDTARQLESHAKLDGRSKQEVVARLITEGLRKPDEVLAPSPARRAAEGSLVKATTSPPEILTLEEVAEFLRVDPTDVEARVRANEIPARRFGNDWRFSREAIVHWMEGTDRVTRRIGMSSGERSESEGRAALDTGMSSGERSESE